MEKETFPGPESQFCRAELALGAAAMARLRAATVLVVGLGAVGSFATEALARTGVGNFRLVDFDRVQPSNINRQLFATWETVGRRKTEAARARLAAINPNARFETRNLLVNV
ncbi:MAG: ThiF family adenylyltransferase, partial [Thermoguttaceae bacterium]|nr:ThiF family adenylyltransferase [Thermoguttaceae bacterium]